MRRQADDSKIRSLRVSRLDSMSFYQARRSDAGPLLHVPGGLCKVDKPSTGKARVLCCIFYACYVFYWDECVLYLVP